MKPEDLVVGEIYYWNERPVIYVGECKDWLNNECYKFKEEDGFEFGFPLWRLAEFITKRIGEKTMQARKPEEIRLELTEKDYIKALSSLGYDLANYEFEESYSFPTFVLRLKKEADEKTKATD